MATGPEKKEEIGCSYRCRRKANNVQKCNVTCGCRHSSKEEGYRRMILNTKKAVSVKCGLRKQKSGKKWEWYCKKVWCIRMYVCGDDYVLSEWMQFWFNALHSLHYTCSIGFIQTSNFIPFSAFRVENLTNLFRNCITLPRRMNELCSHSVVCLTPYKYTQIYSQIYR